MQELVLCMNATLSISSHKAVAQSSDAGQEDGSHGMDVAVGPSDSKADTLSRKNFMQSRLVLLRKCVFNLLFNCAMFHVTV